MTLPVKLWPLFATAVLFSLMCSAPAPSLAIPGLSGVGVEASKVTFLGEHLAQVLSAHGLRVVTSKDIEMVLGLERQRQLLGCGEGTSCIAELAGGLGVDWVLAGSVAKLEALRIIDVKVISSTDGRRLGGFSVRSEKESELVALLEAAAASLADELVADRPSVQGEVSDRSSGPPGWLGWVAAGVGVASAAVATGMAVKVGDEKRALNPGSPISLTEGAAHREAGTRFQAAAVGCGIAAGVLVIGGAVLVWAPWKTAAVAVVPTPGGGAIAVGGTFP